MSDAELHDFWCPKCKSYEDFTSKETRHIGNQAEPWVYITSYNCCVCNAKGGFPSKAKDYMLGQLWWSAGVSLLWLLIWFSTLDSLLMVVAIGGFALCVGSIWFAVACYSEVLFLIRWKLWELRSGNR
jgi:hypothetical protein